MSNKYSGTRDNNVAGWGHINEDTSFPLQSDQRINILANQFLAVLPVGFPRQAVVNALCAVRPQIDCENYIPSNPNVRVTDIKDFKKIISLLK